MHNIKRIDLGDEVAETVWQILCKSAPCERLLNSLLNCFNDNPVSIDWSKIFLQDSPNESIYMICLADAIIGDSSSKEIAEVRKEPFSQVREDWNVNFITKGGMEWILSVNDAIYSIEHKKLPFETRRERDEALS